MKIYKIWVGPNPIPEHFKQYTDTWTKIEHAEIIPIGNWYVEKVQDSLAVKWALKHNNYAVLNHYIRYHLMYHHGGIYLDLDVEVIRDSPIFKTYHLQIGMELPEWANNHVMISHGSHNDFFLYCMKAMDAMPYDQIQEVELNTGPRLVTRILQSEGFVPKKIDTPDFSSCPEITIHPERVFSPHRWNEKFHPSEIKEDTLCVHHFAHSWKP